MKIHHVITVYSLLSLVSCVWGDHYAASLGEYPVYEVSGDHSDIGYQIGKLGRKRIKTYVDNYPNIQAMRKWILGNGETDFNNLVSYNYNIYPKYVQELLGISEGSGVEYTDIWIMAFRQEIDLLMTNELNEMNEINKKNKTREKSEVNTTINGLEQTETIEVKTETERERDPRARIPNIDKQCSDILVNSDNWIGIGHNEDGWNGTLNSGYYINMTYTSEMNFTNNVSYIFSFGNPSIFAGNGFGFNNFGLITSIDALFPLNISTNKTRGIYFIERSLLDCHSINCVIDTIYDIPDQSMYFSSFGAAINVAQGDTIVNVEISPTNVNVKYLNVTEDGDGRDNYNDDNYYYHFNNYLRLTDVDSINDISSDHRLNRTLELIQSFNSSMISNVDQVIDILSDTKDEKYPIYRDGLPPDTGTVTLSTAIFDIKQGVVQIYEQCNPKECPPFKTFKL